MHILWLAMLVAIPACMDEARRMASNFAKLRGFKLPNPD